MLYRLCIADVKIEINSPFSIITRTESKPFLYTGNEITDCFLEYKEINKLEEPISNPVFSESNHLYCTNENMVYLIRSLRCAPHARVFVTKEKPYTMICEYLPGSESELEYMKNIYSAFGLETILLQFNALILHSSFVNYRENGILFSGTSGVGKSTQASLWEKYEKAEIVNGDRAGLRKKEGNWYAYGLPIAGSSGIYRNNKTSLQCIVLPLKAPVNEVRRATTAEAYRYLYPEFMMHRWDPEFEQKASMIVLELLSEIPVYFMQCLPDQSSVKTLKEYLINEGVIR